MEELKKRLQAFALQAGALLIDGIFLAIWLLIHWSLENYVVRHFHLEGIHGHLLFLLQCIFAVATLFPVLAFIYVDLYSIYVKMRKSISAVEAR